MKLIDILVRELPKRGGWPIESNGCRQFPDGEVCFSNVGKKPDFYTECATDVDLVWRKTVTPHVSREQYEAALAAKNEGWIEWSGGECPVEEGTLVDVKYRDGDDFPDALGVPALSGYGTGSAFWELDGYNNDIIAYRLHKPRESDLNECIDHDAAPVWSGEGLPPVGCFCEVEDLDGMLVYGQGESGEVIAHVENTAVIRMSYGLGCFEARFLRPLRTEADKKRDAAIKELTLVIFGETQDAGMATAAMYAARIYDAGYRKGGE